MGAISEAITDMKARTEQNRLLEASKVDSSAQANAPKGAKTNLPDIYFGSTEGTRKAERALSKLLQENPDLMKSDSDYLKEVIGLKHIKNTYIDKPKAVKRSANLRALYELLTENPDITLKDINEAIKLRKGNLNIDSDTKLPIEHELDFLLARISAKAKRVDIQGKAIGGYEDVDSSNAWKYIDATAAHIIEINGEKTNDKTTLRSILIEELGKEIYSNQSKLNAYEDGEKAGMAAGSVKSILYPTAAKSLVSRLGMEGNFFYKMMLGDLSYADTKAKQLTKIAAKVGENVDLKIAAKTVAKSAGRRAIAIVALKGACRLIPVLGWGMFAYDLVQAARVATGSKKEDNYISVGIRYAGEGLSWFGKNVIAS